MRALTEPRTWTWFRRSPPQAMPEEFRVDPPELEVWRSAMAAFSDPPPPPLPPPGPDVGFIRDVCNAYFAVRRSVARWAVNPADERARQAASGSVRDFDDALKDHKIDVMDLTGKPVSPGSREFEAISQAVPTQGVTSPRVGLLERPMIRLDGKLIQTARGSVEIPA